MKRIMVATALVVVALVGTAGVASACPVKRSDKALAASEILQAWNRGVLIYEDNSFRGMSPRAERWNDQITEDCRGQHWRACLVRIAKGHR